MVTSRCITTPTPIGVNVQASRERLKEPLSQTSSFNTVSDIAVVEDEGAI